MSGAAAKEAWACLLTPPGRGAVAVVRVWGPGAVSVADRAFRPVKGARLARTPRGRLRLGRMGDGLGDEVVAVVLEGDPAEVEVHGHGGAAPLELVLKALEAAGAARAEAVDWLQSSSASPIAAEAAADLTLAPTLRTAEILLDQLHGALEQEVWEVLQEKTPEVPDSLARLDALIARSVVGLRLLAGWRVVLAGRPNVGKSRLLNAMAGFDRAIVDPTPGTTRDLVTVRTAIDGWPVELVDTAGLHTAADPVEAAGMALAAAQHEQADLVILVLDRSEPLAEADRQLLARFPQAIWVENKADLPSAWEPSGPRRLVVSAATRLGIDELLAAISARLVPDPPEPGDAVPFRTRHLRLLTHARDWLASDRTDPALRALTRLLAPPRSITITT